MIPHPKNGPELKTRYYYNMIISTILCSSMNNCPEFLRLLTHATFFEAAIARRMSLSDVVHWAELHVQLRIRTAFAVALSKFW